MNDSQQTTLASICKLLDANDVRYRLIHHEETRTSKDSARVRGENLRIGGKALLVKTEDVFRLFVLSAARKFRSSAIKKHFGCRRVRFASAEELLELTGLVPGCVPPFGRPILPFDLFVDDSIVTNERIAFNAGSLTDSIIMNVDDYLQIATPEVFSFSIEP
ncbi:MAG: hypothetical protein DHS20C16_21130 [Phycisphaerae bacterium]|nr:MAG: hypothetical protein DHS20C16_21130 [Phycisphaerae bacterium]